MLVSNLDFGRKTRVKKYEVVGAAKRKKNSEQYNPGEQGKESGDEVSVCTFLDEPTRVENNFEYCEEVETEEEDIFGVKVDDNDCGKGEAGEKDLKLENEKRRLENAVQKVTINPQ